jgi:hypothetical protein
MLLEISRAEAGLEDEPRERSELRAIVEAAASAVPEREGVTVTVEGEATSRERRCDERCSACSKTRSRSRRPRSRSRCASAGRTR